MAALAYGGERRDAGAKVLAVLPFENLGDSANAYLADGITDELRGKLSAARPASRSSPAAARTSTGARSKPPQDIARELGADYLLTATVRWEKLPDGSSRVRVSPELVDVTPGHAPRTKWQQPFDAAITDVFQVQADIAGQVASALERGPRRGAEADADRAADGEPRGLRRVPQRRGDPGDS